MGTGFPKRSCSNKDLDRDDDSKKSHHTPVHSNPPLVRIDADAACCGGWSLWSASGGVWCASSTRIRSDKSAGGSGTCSRRGLTLGTVATTASNSLKPSHWRGSVTPRADVQNDPERAFQVVSASRLFTPAPGGKFKLRLPLLAHFGPARSFREGLLLRAERT